MDATERAAIGALKTISSAEAMFRQQEMSAATTASDFGFTVTNGICGELDDLVAAQVIDGSFTTVLPGTGVSFRRWATSSTPLRP